MALADTLIPHAPPLRLAEGGKVIRVSNTRVSLDTVVYAFENGATAEEIAHAYDTLQLADVYEVISYYLRNRDEIQDYLAKRRRESAEIRENWEALHPPDTDFRARLLARQANKLQRA